MKSSHRLSALLCAFLLPALLGCQAALGAQLWDLADRPSVAQALEWRAKGLVSAAPLSASPALELAGQIYTGALQIILPLLKDHEVYLLSRDMDEFGDCLTAALSGSSEGEALLKHLHRLPVSRKVASASTPAQLMRWLKVNHLDLDEITKSNRSPAIIDIGWRGQIFKNIISKFVLSHSDEASRWKALNNILTKGLFLLFGPWGPTRLEEVKSGMLSGRYTDSYEVLDILQEKDFVFPGLFDRAPTIRNQTFALRQTQESVPDIIAELKYAFRHWRTRGTLLSSSGDSLTEYDPLSSNDAEVDKKTMLGRQLSLAEYFSAPAQKEWILALAKTVSPAAEKIVAVSEVYRGKRALVRKVKDTSSDTFLAVKTPLDTSNSDQMDSLRRGVSRFKKLAELGLPHSRVLRSSDTEIIKEWIDGLTAKEFFVETSRQGMTPEQTVALSKLIAFFKILKDRGIYIRNLSPSNLVYTGDDWLIIDSSSVQTDLDPKNALLRYRDSISRHWRPTAASICEHLLNGVTQ